ncbi:MAG TPA: ABC transporter ATP-binding protein [Acidimicrobiaceae bacterium]|nr:ABC transporter ATP-binding protein [Acidimicrobiaceae bacterium]
MAPPTAPPAVRLHSVTKRYGDLVAVDSIDLEVPRGSIFGLIGPNGAGKSTTFAMIATLLRPTSGVVEVLGERPNRNAGAVRARMGYMPDVLGVYDDMVVDEYLRFFAGAFGVPASAHEDTIESLLELVDLAGKRHSEVNSLSRGMKQRLSLARALVNDPDLLVLDEPASGLDPRARVELRLLLSQLQDMGKTIIISSHILAELAEMCSEIAILERGRLLASGPPTAIRDQLGSGRQIEARYADGTVERFDVDGTVGQQALLRRLVQEGRELIEFREVGSGLEDLFMRLTQGEVQ